MELTNTDILALANILPPITKAVPDRHAKLKYRLTRDHAKVFVKVQEYEKEERELVDSYSAKDEEGNVVRPLKEDGTPDETRITISDPTAFVDARNELLASKVSIDLMTIPLSWFDGIDAPTEDLYRFCDFIIEED